jgi:endogenous inhibitor of DNA gyrase (YacG/DUF329 family)
MRYKKTCEICGTEFEAWNSTQRLCSKKCRNKDSKKYYQEYYAVYKPIVAETKPKTVLTKTASDIAAEARKVGMSYGQYVALNKL